jgi:hypothetical protein
LGCIATRDFHRGRSKVRVAPLSFFDSSSRTRCPSGSHVARIDCLWSPVGATSGKHRQVGLPPNTGSNKSACRRVRVVVDGKEELDSNHSAKRPAARSRGGSSLSIEARFRGPLVAQTWTGRLAQPCEAASPLALKVPANEAVPRRSSLHVVVPDSACHAGGRGFESRRSRLPKCLQHGICVVSVDAPRRLMAQSRGPSVQCKSPANGISPAVFCVRSHEQTESPAALPAGLMPRQAASAREQQRNDVVKVGARSPASLASRISTTACRRVFASDTRWTVVRGSDLEEGESRGLPMWSRHVGDPILESNLTRRVDFAPFMVEALENDELIPRPQRSSPARHPRRSRTPPATELLRAPRARSSSSRPLSSPARS